MFVGLYIGLFGRPKMGYNVQPFLQCRKSVLLKFGLSLSKVISMSLYSKAPVIFDGLEL